MRHASSNSAMARPRRRWPAGATRAGLLASSVVSTWLYRSRPPAADRALEDAWILVPELFGPSLCRRLVGGRALGFNRADFPGYSCLHRSARHHHHQVLHNIPFVVTHAATEHHFGTKPVWKKDKKILVSDPAKTIADMLSNPWTGGGIQHVADCLKQF